MTSTAEERRSLRLRLREFSARRIRQPHGAMVAAREASGSVLNGQIEPLEGRTMSAGDGHQDAAATLRVLMLIPHSPIHGPIPRITTLLVDHLKRLGCDIETEYWSRHTDQESMVQKALGRAGDLWRVRTRLRRSRFDVLFIVTAHTWAGLARDIPLVLATKRVCPHRVLQFHGSYSDLLNVPGHAFLKFASRVLVRACDATLVLSRQERDDWSSFWPAGRFHVVANPFVPEQVGDDLSAAASDLRAGSAATGLPYRGETPTVLFVGRLMPEKGVLDLVKAVARVNSAGPCRLVVAGSGPSAAAVAAEAEGLGIARRVELRGHVSGNDLTRCYREADVFALPTYYREGFPTVLLEAMSVALPIVTTKVRGAADRLAEGVNALFVPARHPDALADALGRLIGDHDLRASMAANNLAKVKEFAPEAVTPQYLAILRSVVSGKPEHGAPVERIAPIAGAVGSYARSGGPDAWPRLQERALQAALMHAAWLQEYGATSWDHHDMWANPLGRRAKAVYYQHGWLGLPLVAPFVALDNAVPASRRLFWHRQRFAIADAHFAMGFFALTSAHSPQWMTQARSFIDALIVERCAGETEYCWGYPFDWETCFGTWRAGTPLITSTPYAYEAFEAAHTATAEPGYLATMESIARFAHTRIPTTEVAPGVKASAYSPQDSRRVVNASAYRGFLLAAAGTRFQRSEWVAEARATLAFVLRSQRPEGSWLYAMDGKDKFVDNLHTCLVLKSLFKAWRTLGDEELLTAVRDGYGFYKSYLLDEDGLPVPFARTQRLTLQRRDLYDYAEGINLALLLADVDRAAESVAATLLADFLGRWIMPDGHFATRETYLGRNTVPYHRWAQAQMFRALTQAALQGVD